MDSLTLIRVDFLARKDNVSAAATGEKDKGDPLASSAVREILQGKVRYVVTTGGKPLRCR